MHIICLLFSTPLLLTNSISVVTAINECSEGLDNCHMDADCTDTVGSFTCTCRAGFTGNGTFCQLIGRKLVGNLE